MAPGGRGGRLRSSAWEGVVILRVCDFLQISRVAKTLPFMSPPARRGHFKRALTIAHFPLLRIFRLTILATRDSLLLWSLRGHIVAGECGDASTLKSTSKSARQTGKQSPTKNEK